MKTINLKAATVQQFINGINTQLAKGKSVTLGNKQYTPTVLVQTLTGFITANEATADAALAYHEAVAAQRALAPVALGLVRELKEYAYATYGDAVTPLAAFGLLPRKAAVLSTADKAAAAAKATATRKARAPQANVAEVVPATTAPAASAVAAPVTK